MNTTNFIIWITGSIASFLLIKYKFKRLYNQFTISNIKYAIVWSFLGSWIIFLIEIIHYIIYLEDNQNQ